MKADIGISQENLEAVARSLNILLADEHVLYVKTRNYHWNVEGSNFMEMHQFYEDQYNLLAIKIDEIAERVRFIGHYPKGRLKDFLEITNLAEQEFTTVQKEQIRHLLDDHETIIRRLHGEIDQFTNNFKEQGSADFITGVMEMHEKMAWMLRAFLK